MKFRSQIKRQFIHILRLLENEVKPNRNKTINYNTQQEQLKDLYIYIAILAVIIIAILGGYALYRKCVEKKALEEMEREYQLMIMNLLNSASSQASSSQEDKRPHSFNNINPNYYQNFQNESRNRNLNNSLEFNHEERMENIRKKFGNSIVIKCLIKKQIEEIQYTKNIGEDYGDACTICMENFVDFSIISKTPCEHIFHKKCFDTFLKGIQKKDKILCPNCNQNLLINKKFLKLRVKTKKIEIKKNSVNKKEIKESELNLENDIKNRDSVATNKYEDNAVNKNNEEIIFIRKKNKKDKSKISDKNYDNLNDKNEDIYNPLQLKIRKNVSFCKSDKDTIIPNNDKNENEKNNVKDQVQKRQIVLINNYDKKKNTLKNALTSGDYNSKLFNKRRKINFNNANSERSNISKKSCSPINPSEKQDN